MTKKTTDQKPEKQTEPKKPVELDDTEMEKVHGGRDLDPDAFEPPEGY